MSEHEAMARSALQRGELERAMQLAARALLEGAPVAPLCLLIDEIAAEASDPLPLVPLEAGPHTLAFGVARVRVLFAIGAWTEALALFERVARFAPVCALFEVVRVSLVPSVIESVGLTVLQRTVLTLVRVVTSPPALDPEERRASRARSGSAILEAMRGVFPDASELYSAESLLLRRLGDRSGALAVAALGAARFPDVWSCLAAMANALADSGRAVEAELFARRALALSPEDGSPLYDLALGYLNGGAATDAVRVLGELLARFPDYPEALERLTEARAMTR